MYSTPVYALRFAAHCRSRLRFTEPGAHDETRGRANGAPRFWMRLPSQGAGIRRQCGARRLRGATS